MTVPGGTLHHGFSCSSLLSHNGVSEDAVLACRRLQLLFLSVQISVVRDLVHRVISWLLLVH